MLTIIQGDALEQLRTLPSESVQCCVTSPPYWGLRDYGTAQWEGGDDGCEHAPRKQISDIDGPAQRLRDKPSWDCKCGAKRIDSQLGLEKTPEGYVAKMVEVFREVRRVLRKDGTLWLNLGDSYTSTSGNLGYISAEGKTYNDLNIRRLNNKGNRIKNLSNLKPKDLCGIPWRVAFALQADGWWLRSDIIWAKPNPMPESVTDRPTKSHEYLFLLTKSSSYFYDAEAIKEAPITEPHAAGYTSGESYAIGPMSRNGHSQREGDQSRVWAASGTRNKRSVWTVATAPYPDAHFATYPPDLIKPCIMAGTRVGDTVLDPFAGSGTTGMVTIELGRKAVLIELNPKYIELIEQRCDITPGLQLA